MDRDQALGAPEPAQPREPFADVAAARLLDLQPEQVEQRLLHLGRRARGRGQVEGGVPVTADHQLEDEVPPALEGVRRERQPGLLAAGQPAPEGRVGVLPVGDVLVGPTEQEVRPQLGLHGSGGACGDDRLLERLAQPVLGPGERAGVAGLAQRDDHVGDDVGEVEPLGERERLERDRLRLLDPAERGEDPGVGREHPGPHGAVSPSGTRR